MMARKNTIKKSGKEVVTFAELPRRRSAKTKPP